MAGAAAIMPNAPRGRSSNVGALEAERAKALSRLEDLRQFYDRPDAAQLLQQMQSQASGKDAPFTGDVVGSMLSQNADSGAGQVASDQDMIRQRMSNAGLGGSGLEASAMVTSRRRAAALNRAGRREITSRAALENYQARERAMGRVQQYLAERQNAESQAGMAEVDFRSRMQSVEDSGGQSYGNIETNDRNPMMGVAGGGFDDGMGVEEPFRPTWTEQTGGWDRAPQASGGDRPFLPFQGGTSNAPGYSDFMGPAPAPGRSMNGGPNIDQALANARGRAPSPVTDFGLTNRTNTSRPTPQGPGRANVSGADRPQVPNVTRPAFRRPS